MNLKEVILPVRVFDFGPQSFLRIRELLVKVFELLSNLLWRPLDELVLLIKSLIPVKET